jgi:hypothetical protein
MENNEENTFMWIAKQREFYSVDHAQITSGSAKSEACQLLGNSAPLEPRYIGNPSATRLTSHCGLLLEYRKCFVLEKCYFILMHSRNLDRLQLAASALMQSVCWPKERDGESGL